jgi:hypothetical protein
MMTLPVTVELTEAEAELCKFFQKHEDAIEVLSDRGIFDVTNGSAILHFDTDGHMIDVDIQ